MSWAQEMSLKVSARKHPKNHVENGVSRKRRAHEVEISEDLLWSLLKEQRGLCYLSGLKMDLTDRRSSCFVSLDRVESSKGYVPGNVALACRWVNLGKNDWSADEIRENFKKIISRRKNVDFQTGERNHQSKLTREKVLEMRRAMDEGERPTDCARRFGVSDTLASQIRKRTVWKDA